MRSDAWQFVHVPTGGVFRDPLVPDAVFIKLSEPVNVSGPKNARMAGDHITGTSYRFFEDSHLVVPVT